jgi:hypothetical protein
MGCQSLFAKEIFLGDTLVSLFESSTILFIVASKVSQLAEV